MISCNIDKSAVSRILGVIKQRVVDNANRDYRAKVYWMFEDLLLVSPQFSGDFVSNWRVSTSVPVGYAPLPEKSSVAVSQRPHKAGDPEAVTYARDVSDRVPFTYKDIVYFVNETPLEFTPTTVTGPDGKMQNLRLENIIPGGVRLSSYLHTKYGK